MKRFKTILIVVILSLVLSTVSFAEMRSFSWEANTDLDLNRYALYVSSTSGEYTLGSGNEIATIPAGTETYTYDVPVGVWYYVITAFDDTGNESDISDECVHAVKDTTPPHGPNGFECFISTAQ